MIYLAVPAIILPHINDWRLLRLLCLTRFKHGHWFLWNQSFTGNDYGNHWVKKAKVGEVNWIATIDFVCYCNLYPFRLTALLLSKLL